MLDTYPGELNVDRVLLVSCIEACADCADSCTQCADASLSHRRLQELVKSIRLNLDCANVCATTERVVSRQTESDSDVTHAVLQACIAICRSCGDECELHGKHGMEHCKVSSEECRRCEQA